MLRLFDDTFFGGVRQTILEYKVVIGNEALLLDNFLIEWRQLENQSLMMLCWENFQSFPPISSIPPSLVNQTDMVTRQEINEVNKKNFGFNSSFPGVVPTIRREMSLSSQRCSSSLTCITQNSSCITCDTF